MNSKKLASILIAVFIGSVLKTGFGNPSNSNATQLFQRENVNNGNTESDINFNSDTCSQLIEIKENDLKNSVDALISLPTETLSSNSRSHDLVEYHGIGEDLTVYHESNRTDSGVDLSFTNGSTTNYEIPIGEDWVANEVQVSLTNLKDNKNWVNGTFAYGASNSSFVTSNVTAITTNDSPYIQNPYQNWTFSYYDNPSSYANRFSGNYYDSNTAAGRSSLELLIAGAYDDAYYGYSINDLSRWASVFNIPRGIASNALLKFQVNPYHVAGFNSWDLRVSLNGKLIYSIGVQSLATLVGAQQWGEIPVPMGLWTNNSAIFPTSLDAMSHNISFELVYAATTAKYSFTFPNIAYQQLLIANVQLFVQAEVKSEQIQLTGEGSPLSSSSAGIATINLLGSWTYPSASINFAAINNETNTFSFTASFNIFATKNAPSSFSTTNFDSSGTSFSLSPGGGVNWEFYIYFSVPIGYKEYNFTLTYPTDWIIDWVSSPQLPGTNQIENVDDSVSGALKIPVKDISETPDGFWRFHASSPNYLQDLNTYRNSTNNPSSNDWTLNSSFFAGDYVNITASLSNSFEFTNFAATTAELTILLPNGSIWAEHTEIINPSTNGELKFTPIHIPLSGPNYLVGEYGIIIRWNNSIADTNLYETGTIQGSFIVKHLSQLIPDQKYFEQVVEGSLVSIRLNFLDVETGAAIEGAILNFVNFQNQLQKLTEIAPGYYFTQVEVSDVVKGNNSIILTGSHPLFENSSAEITFEAILPVKLIALESPGLTVPWNDDFTITLNYTELSTGMGIEDGDFYIHWFASYEITELSGGLYKVFLNNSINSDNRYWSMEIISNTYGYKAEVIFLDIVIGKRTTDMQIFLHGQNATINTAIEVPIGTHLNLTSIFFDQQTQKQLIGTDFQLRGAIEIDDYEIIPDSVRGIFFINTTRLGLGVHYISVIAELPFYEPNSKVIEITVRQIETTINTTIGSYTYAITPKDNLMVEFDLLNDDFGGTLTGASFTYSSALSSGNLQYNASSGHYYFELEQIPEGTHTITITGFLGPEYHISTIQIIIVAAYPEIEPTVPTWVLVLGTMLLIALSIALIGYLTVWKYPKIVRTLRSLQFRISSGKPLKGHLKSGKDLFIQSYLTINQPFGHFMADKNKLI